MTASSSTPLAVEDGPDLVGVEGDGQPEAGEEAEFEHDHEQHQDEAAVGEKVIEARRPDASDWKTSRMLMRAEIADRATAGNRRTAARAWRSGAARRSRRCPPEQEERHPAPVEKQGEEGSLKAVFQAGLQERSVQADRNDRAGPRRTEGAREDALVPELEESEQPTVNSLLQWPQNDEDARPRPRWPSGDVSRS